MTLGRFTHTTCLKVSTGASNSSMFSKDFSPFLVLFQNYVGCCQHPQSFLFYHPFNVYTVQSQSMDKSSLLSSMYHQGIRLFLFSCTDVLIMLAFVLRLDSSWSIFERQVNDHVYVLGDICYAQTLLHIRIIWGVCLNACFGPISRDSDSVVLGQKSGSYIF